MARKGKKRSKGGRKFGCLPLCCGGEDTRVVDIAGDIYNQPNEEEESKVGIRKDEEEDTMDSLTSIESFAENPFVDVNRTQHDHQQTHGYLFEKTTHSSDFACGSPSSSIKPSEKEKEIHTIVKTKIKDVQTTWPTNETKVDQSVLDISWESEIDFPIYKQVPRTLTDVGHGVNVSLEADSDASVELANDHKAVNVDTKVGEADLENSWGSKIDPSVTEPRDEQASGNAEQDVEAAFFKDSQAKDTHELEMNIDVEIAQAPGVNTKVNKAASNISLEAEASIAQSDNVLNQSEEAETLDIQTGEVADQIEQEPSDIQEEESEDFSFDETIPMKISIQVGKATDSPVQSSNEGSSALSKMVEPGTAHIELSSDSWPSIDDQIVDTEAIADEISVDIDAHDQVLDRKQSAEICVNSQTKDNVLGTEAVAAESCVGSSTSDQMKLQTEPYTLPLDASATPGHKTNIDAKDMVEIHDSDSGSLTDPELYRAVDFNVSPYVSSDSSVEKIASGKSIFNQEKQLATVGKDISSMDVEKRKLPPLGSGAQHDSLSLKPKSNLSFASSVKAADESLKVADSTHDHVKPVEDLKPILKRSSMEPLKAPNEFLSGQAAGHSGHSFVSQDPQLKDRPSMLHQAKMETLRISKSDVPSGHVAGSIIPKRKERESAFASVNIIDEQSFKRQVPEPQLLQHLRPQLNQSQLQPATSDQSRSELNRPKVQPNDLPPHLHRPKMQPPRVGIGPKSQAQSSSGLHAHLHRPQLHPLKVPVSGSDLKGQQPYLHHPQLRPEKVEFTSHAVGSATEQIPRSSSFLSQELKSISFERVMNLDGTTLLDHPQTAVSTASKERESVLGAVTPSGSKLGRPAISPLQVNKKMPTSPTSSSVDKKMPSSSSVNKKCLTSPSGPGSPFKAQETLLKTINLDDKKSSKVLEGPHTSGRLDPIQPAKWNSSSSTHSRKRFDSKLPESTYAKSAPDARVGYPKTTSKSLPKSDNALSQAAPTSDMEPLSKQARRKGTKCRRDMLTENSPVSKSPSPPKDGRSSRGKTFRTKMVPGRPDATSPYSKEPCPPPIGKKTRSRQKVLTPPPLKTSESSSSEIELHSPQQKCRTKIESGRMDAKSPYSKEPHSPIGKKTRSRKMVSPPPPNDSESSSSEMELHSPRPAWNLLKADSDRVSSYCSVETNFGTSPNKESSSDCAAVSDVTDNEEIGQIQEEESRPHIPRPPPSCPPSTSGGRRSRPFPPLHRQKTENTMPRAAASSDGKPKKQVTFNLPRIDSKAPTDSPPRNRQN